MDSHPDNEADPIEVIVTLKRSHVPIVADTLVGALSNVRVAKRQR